MRAFAVVLISLFVVTCGAGLKRSSFAPVPPPHTAPPPAAEEDGEREDSYNEAADFYLLKRAGEGGALPVERYFAAKRHAGSMPRYSVAQGRFTSAAAKSAAREINVGTWQPLGPGNVGGRTRSLVIRPDDPNTMYAGSVGGGVWKTIDGGNTWNPLTDLLPSIGIGALAMDPQNPDTLYAGTGEWYTNSTRGDSIRGAGIFKTTDGGATWTQLPGTASPATTSFYFTNKIVVSPNDSNKIYAATYGGIWFSPDAGTTWTRVLSRTGTQYGCQDLVIRTDQGTDYLYAACAWYTGVAPAIYRNVDAGGSGTWDKVFTTDNMGRTALALAPSNQSMVYALVSSAEASGDYRLGLLGVYRSASNGDQDTWETRVTNKDPSRLNAALLSNPREAFADICTGGKAAYLNQGEYDLTIAVDPVNPDVVWAGGVDVFRSDDGGKNWGIAGFWQASGPKLVHADVHALVFASGYDGVGNQTLFAATDGGLYRTDNALSPPATGDRAACSPYPTQVAWTNINNGYAVTQFYHGAVYPGGGAYVGGSQDNGTNLGSDATGPLAWTRVLSGDGGFFAIDPNDPNLVYGESQNSSGNAAISFVRSTNGGRSFSAAAKGITEPTANFAFITPFEMDPQNSKRLYIGGRTLWRTSDGAANWTEASASIGNTSGVISAIAISPSDPARVVFGTSLGFIFRTTQDATATDKSTAWTSVQPRAGYLSSLAFDPADATILYATYSQFKSDSSQSHIYKSTDGGATWAGIDGSGGSGLPDIPVYSIVPDPQNKSTLYVGSDIGLFVSLDGGATWAADDNPFANAVTEKLVLDRSAGTSSLYAFTHGRGVWKTALPGGGDPCQYKLPTTSVSWTAYGANTFIGVVTGPNCSWSAIPMGSLSLSSPAGGKGSGSFTAQAFLNTSVQAQNYSVLVQDQVVKIKQDGAIVAKGNDEPASAFVVATLPSFIIEDTTSATESPNDPVHSCTQSKDSKTVWFKATAPRTANVNIGFSLLTPGVTGSAGVVLAVYDSASKEVACVVTAQGSLTGSPRYVLVPVTKGETYSIELSSTISGAPAGATIKGGTLWFAPVF